MSLTQNLPYICANVAITADGKMNRSHDISSVFTSNLDLQQLLAIRTQCDGILVGRKTLECDEMTLTIPGVPVEKQPARIIASKSGNFDFSHKIFNTPGGKIYLISQQGIPVLPLPPNTTSFVGSIHDFIQEAPSIGLKHLHCEGGAEIFYYLFQLQLIELIHITMSPNLLFGHKDALTILGEHKLDESIKLELLETELNKADELFLKYRPVYSS